jgi:Ca2+-transporting ATPase
LAISVPYLRHIMGLSMPTPVIVAGAAIMLALTFIWLEGLRLALRLSARLKATPLAR